MEQRNQHVEAASPAARAAEALPPETALLIPAGEAAGGAGGTAQ